LVVVAELDRRAAIDPALDPAAAGPVLDAIRRAVAERLEAQVHDVVLVRAGTIPKTSSGKVQRHACKAAYLAGTLESLPPHPQPLSQPPSRPPGEGGQGGEGRRAEALLAYLGRQAARAAKLSEIPSPDQPLSGLDSLAALELSHAVEADLGL